MNSTPGKEAMPRDQVVPVSTEPSIGETQTVLAAPSTITTTPAPIAQVATAKKTSAITASAVLTWIVRAILFICTVIGGVWGWRELNKHKAISFVFLERSAYRSPGFQDDEDLQIVHKGKVVSNPYWLYFTVKNTGTDAIRSEDFDGEQPISLECPVPILKVKVLAKKPSDLQVVYSHVGKRVVLRPSLFNKGEEFTVAVLTDGDPGWPHPSCRIVDAKPVTVEHPVDATSPKETGK
jgi:hypothetical protein